MERIEAARRVHSWLRREDPPVAGAGMILGFGHFDPKIPAQCVELWRDRAAPRIVYTGGMGAGTADLGRAEARYFVEETQRLDALAAGAVVLVEDFSTNTGENLDRTAHLLRVVLPSLAIGTGVRAAVLVANAYRSRRVHATWRHRFPGVPAACRPPEAGFEEEAELFRSKGEDLVKLMAGEVRRIAEYPARGFCDEEPVPEWVMVAAARM